MNYDYNNMETEKSQNFPYGTDGVFVLKKQDILYYKAMPYEHESGAFCQIKIVLRDGEKIMVYFNNSDEVKEAMGVLGDIENTIIIARAKNKDEHTFQRDFISHNRMLYEEAIDNL